MADLAAKLGKDVSSLRRILAELEAHSLCKRTGQPKAMWEKRAIVVYLPKA
jgi:DNA-binding MarR family transcriptional regulator